MQQHIAFFEAYRVLQDHMEELVITKGLACLLWASIPVDLTDTTWHPSTREEEEHGRSTQEHHWKSNRAWDKQIVEARTTSTPVGATGNSELRQTRYHLLANEKTSGDAEEKHQFLGPDMERIADLSIQEKMSTLSSLTTLTINIQKVLQNWTKFQHQLAVTVEAIVEVCVQKWPTIRLHSP